MGFVAQVGRIPGDSNMPKAGAAIAPGLLSSKDADAQEARPTASSTKPERTGGSYLPRKLALSPLTGGYTHSMKKLSMMQPV
jgi:hypothetical protein